MIIDHTPVCLRGCRQWVAWKYVVRDGRQTKAPVNPHTGGLASSKDPATWGSFEEALAAWKRAPDLAGVGFVFTPDDPYCGIDIDNCRDPLNGYLQPWAMQVVKQLSSYTEVSPSGKGVKIFLKASKPGTKCRTAYHDGEVEIYDRGRYFTVTGMRLTDMPTDVQMRQEELDVVYREILGNDGDKEQIPERAIAAQASAASEPLTDDEIIQLASTQRRSGAKFATLWAGNWNAHFNSASEADSSVIFTLAYYTKDAAQIDRLFRNSGLMRDKWDQLHGGETYGVTTIQKALAKVTGQYQKKRRRTSTRPAPAAPKNSDLPAIVLDNIQLSELTDQTLKAVAQANTPPQVFVRARNLTRVVCDENGQPKIETFDRVKMRCRLAEVANFFTLRKGEGGGYERVGTNPPLSLAENVLARTAWELPPLTGIARAPILRQDGTICTQPGYDAASRLVYCPDPDLVLTPIIEYPNTDEILACVDILLNVFSDFPFADEPSRANALAILFTLLMRPVITGNVPLAIVDAPVQGTGKSLLVTSLATIAVGNVAAESIPARDNDEEWRKKITSILLAASPFVHLDNIPDNTTISSPALAAALTAREWSDRLLGGNETVRLPSRAVWAATGNNLRVAGDMPRRSYSVRLDANSERPWTRSNFKIRELEQYVPEHRGNLLSAALTIVRGWYTNGTPRAEVPKLGSFERWASTIGSVLKFAGITGFLGNLEQTQSGQDEEKQQWTAFFDVWWQCFNDKPVTADALSRLILPRKDELPQAAADPFVNCLPEPLLVNRDRGEGSLKRSIGRNLSRLTGRIFEKRKLCAAGSDGNKHVRRWQLQSVSDAAPDDSQPGEFA
jgi:hypothetical protein